MEIMDKLREIKKESGLTDYRIAKLTGRPVASVSLILKRKTPPTVTTLQELCDVMDISITELFVDQEDAIYLSAQERELVDKWSAVTSEQKSAITGLIYSMKNERLDNQ